MAGLKKTRIKEKKERKQIKKENRVAKNLLLLNPGNLAKEVYTYGYHFSWKTHLFVIGACIAGMGVIGLLFQLKWKLLVIVLIAMMFVYVFSYPKYHAEQVMAAFFGVVYVGVMLSYIYQTRMIRDGAFLVWLIFLCSWGCDTCAYCVGMLIGKHKMSPVLSPKKSVEGAVGGVVGAALLGAIYAAVVGSHLEAENPVITYAIICAVGALISMVGDLAASAIKRNHNIKDYGTLIPGHGGIMDRFDSVIFTAPVIYYLSMFMMR